MDNIMDSELASEMVKLLAQELKAVRAQLREAEKVVLQSPQAQTYHLYLPENRHYSVRWFFEWNHS